MKQPVTMRALMEAIFAALGEAGEREGTRFVVPSGYGEGPLTIDVQEVAVELLERFDIAEPEAAADGN
jgi:hypothetical protein